MGADKAPRLAPIAILIVEDQVQMAEQLAELLKLWGAQSATVVASFAEAVAHFAAHPMPQLVMLDHLLLDGTGCEIAIWLLARPSLRRQTVVVAYTNSERSIVQRSLRELLERLERDEASREQLLGAPNAPERKDVELLLRQAMIDHQAQEGLFEQLYDAYLSKRLSMREVRAALVALFDTP